MVLAWQDSDWKFTHWELIAQSLILLPIALGDCDGIVVVLMVEHIVRDVSYPPESTATIECSLEIGLNARPDLDSGTIAGVGHGNVVDVEVFHDIGDALVLA